METRTQKLSDQSRHDQLKKILDFDSHTVTAANNTIIEQAVCEAKNIIERQLEQNGALSPELKFLCRQVTVYYLFCLNNNYLGQRYASAYLAQTLPDTLEQAEAFTLMGYVDVLDSRQITSTFLYKALNIYSLPEHQSDSNPNILAGQALAFRCLALFHMRTDSKELALQFIQRAITIDRNLCASNPDMRLALALSLQILGDIHLSSRQHFHAFLTYFEALDIRRQRYAEHHDVVVLNRVDLDKALKQVSDEGLLHQLITHYNQDFSFDWNMSGELASSRTKAGSAILFISIIFNHLNPPTPENEKALGQLLLKLGSYFTLTTCRNDIAQSLLNMAEALVTGDERAWVWNHLALIYMQQLTELVSASPDESTVRNHYKSLYEFILLILSATVGHSSPEEIRIHAFARTIEAMLYRHASGYFASRCLDDHDQSSATLQEIMSGYYSAIGCFKYALSLYKAIDANDAQYKRTMAYLGRTQVEVIRFMETHGLSREADYVKQDSLITLLELEKCDSEGKGMTVKTADCLVDYADYFASGNDINQLTHAASLYRKAADIFARLGSEKSRAMNAEARAINVSDKISLIQTYSRRTHVFFKPHEPAPYPKAPVSVHLSSCQP